MSVIDQGTGSRLLGAAHYDLRQIGQLQQAASSKARGSVVISSTCSFTAHKPKSSVTIHLPREREFVSVA